MGWTFVLRLYLVLIGWLPTCTSWGSPPMSGGRPRPLRTAAATPTALGNDRGRNDDAGSSAARPRRIRWARPGQRLHLASRGRDCWLEPSCGSSPEGSEPEDRNELQSGDRRIRARLWLASSGR